MVTSEHGMRQRYAVPALAEYILTRQRAEYEYRPQRYASKITVLMPQKPLERPVENPSVLESTIFRSYLDSPSESWDFMADQVTLEKYQLRILLGQLAARHNISASIRNELYTISLAQAGPYPDLPVLRLSKRTG